MAMKLYSDVDIQNIANAIRSKNGSSDTYKVSEMATAISNIPNSYSASDEGKVVSNGALVAQTSDTVTANDTYDTTLINSLTVNVSGGGGSSNFAKGTVTYASDTTVNASGTVLNLSIPFKPDMFFMFLTKDSWDARSTWSNNILYCIMFAKENVFVPLYRSSTAGSENWKNSDGYIVTTGANRAATSGNTSGYGVQGFSSLIDCVTYPNWQIVQDGSNYKVQVAKFSTAVLSISQGTHNWYAWKF